MKVEIQKIVYPGKSFASQNGKIIFTNEGLPGEIAEISPIRERKNYIEAQTLSISNESGKRVKPLCSHYKTCSSYQYIDYAYQLELKKLQIEEIFKHTVKKELTGFEIKPSGKIWEYRNKLRLSLLWKNNNAVLAYHAPETHDEFVPIDECYLASKNMNNLFSSLLKIINTNRFTFIEEIEIKENSNGSLLAVIYGKTPDCGGITRTFPDEITGKFDLSGIIYIGEKNRREKIIYGKNYLEEKISGKVFRIGAQSFFQINISTLELLIKDMDEMIKTRNFKIAADLYCGIGTFGIIFADKAQKMLGVELLEENTSFLKENIALNKINNYSFKKGPSERLISEIFTEKIKTLIVDPPRKGIGENVCKELLKAGPEHIFYVSCDPITLARDLKMLLQKYDLAKVYGYDFFPHTPHIEILTILDKK